MKLLIDYKENLNKLALRGINFFPDNIRTGLIDYLTSKRFRYINEIRLHRDNKITLIVDSKTFITDLIADERDIRDTVEKICDGSIYAHINTIKDGYINAGNGLRAGICGRAIYDNDKLTSITDISSLNLRFPNNIPNAGLFVYNSLLKDEFKKSTLLFSAPGVGKTTILRDVVKKICKYNPSLRFALIDTREEISPFIDSSITGNVYLSYPKGIAIELATKSMTPELIICDEISSIEEAISITNSANCGVSILATTHAGSFEELKAKQIIKELITSKIFSKAIGIYRKEGEKSYHFSSHEL